MPPPTTRTCNPRPSRQVGIEVLVVRAMLLLEMPAGNSNIFQVYSHPDSDAADSVPRLSFGCATRATARSLTKATHPARSHYRLTRRACHGGVVAGMWDHARRDHEPGLPMPPTLQLPATSTCMPRATTPLPCTTRPAVRSRPVCSTPCWNETKVCRFMPLLPRCDAPNAWPPQRYIALQVLVQRLQECCMSGSHVVYLVYNIPVLYL
ncbi:hypothetical protein GGX14DRAFT_566893 [Mycena pura]|uniref:Uncharacterized protein n=1 Tax=Mycena pura TaxID=153505 RepID=A0AAD6VG08_9AGAR|nr:hypothetical protein GGX14DRAFT_566893 [Mycena pura]